MSPASFRDRFWTRPVARAVTAPSSILLAGAAAAIAVVAAPVTLPWAIGAGIVVGAGAYGVRVLAAVPRRRDARSHIDPFRVQEPWRRFVTDALDSHRRLTEIVATVPAGPLRTQLDSIADRLDEGVEEIWRVCQRGHSLSETRRHLDVESPRAELAQIEQQPAEAWAAGTRLGQTADALRAQVAGAERMDAVITDAVAQVRLLDARLDEAVVRAAELSGGTGGAALATAVGGDVEGIVTEMETLRAALDELDHPSARRPGPGPSAP